MKHRSFPPVNRLAPFAIILAYREDTSQLEQTLKAEGFSVIFQRATYTEEELTYSRTIRCLLNHREAWKWASTRTACTLVVESDFVPCTGLGSLPAPFDPIRHGPLAWGFLYSGGPRILRAHDDGALEGHASCPVALVVSPQSAALLARYAEHEIAHCDPREHSLWDTHFQWWVMGRQARCFLPLRQYGEHGGAANPEHALGRIGWTAGVPYLRDSDLFNNHRAECLVGPLHFLPPYARGSRTRFRVQRLIARLVGWGRLLSGRVAMPVRELTLRERWRVRLIALYRLF
ncbi:MAG: hypothetical protein ACHQ4G_08215 [Opitutales bacterium]